MRDLENPTRLPSSTRAASETASDGDTFYAALTPFRAFAGITEASHYTALPDDWVVGIADVVHSTEAILQGRYKAVNTVGAAVLAAVTNMLPGVSFPFVFGGDGASLALPKQHAAAATDALARTAAWATASLDLELRIAMIPVAAIREAGFDVRVARYAASREVSYAMVAGGGLTWADAQLKLGNFAIPPAALGQEPDLRGLFCGFSPIRSQRGVILSLIAIPLIEGPLYAALVRNVLALLDADDKAGQPFSMTAPLPAWLGSGVDRLIASRVSRSPTLARGALILRAIRLRLIHTIGLTAGGFSPAHFRRQLVRNTDFRKFDDGLRMTIDCTPAVADAIEARLIAERDAGVVKVGTHRQAHANLTCYIPSAIRDDHVHFVDGAAGGYAAAAAKLKSWTSGDVSMA